MRNIFFSILVLLIITPLYSQTANVTVTITGLENTKGNVEIGLYNSEDDFPIYGREFLGATESPNIDVVTTSFKNIPEGTYAIVAWHDENENQELDKNLFGAPKESFGFSNNQFGTFGPPDFEVVSFEIEDGRSLNLSIELK